MEKNIIMVTAGEWPEPKGLLISQVLETARSLKQRGYSTQWFAAIPLMSFIKRLVLRKPDLNEIKAKCAQENVHFSYKIIPVTLGSPYSFQIRKFFHKRMAIEVKKMMQSLSGLIVLHARSYYAAEICIYAKGSVSNNSNIVTSFDMRSLLPNEVPLASGWVGVAFFGFFKRFEYMLLNLADLSFLPLEHACTHFEKELGVKVNYAPIQGFDRIPGWELVFDRKWEEKKLGYSGSIGQWNNPEFLIKVFNSFEGYTPSLAIKPIPIFSNYECKFYDQEELVGYYDSLLALVIPGIALNKDYFITSKMRFNAFFTKASEALTRGVPLIVNAEINELAEFVIKHNCGIVFSIVDNELLFSTDIKSLDAQQWKVFSENAAKVGSKFTRSKVLDIYEGLWNKKYESSIN